MSDSENCGSSIEAELIGIIAQLRHAYEHLSAERVTKQKEFADGLIAPQIRRLEKLARDY